MQEAQTAYHEAGHAVVSYRLGFYIGPVDIIPNDERLGVSLGESVWADGSRDADYIVSLFAGGAAQRRFDSATGDEGCGSDHEEAAELLRFRTDLSESGLREKAEALVSQHWAEIEAVAQALVEAKQLRPEEVDFICDAVAEGLDWREELRKFRIVLSNYEVP